MFAGGTLAWCERMAEKQLARRDETQRAWEAKFLGACKLAWGQETRAKDDGYIDQDKYIHRYMVPVDYVKG